MHRNWNHPKVLDKIDLDAIDSSTRPKKSAKKDIPAEPEKAKKSQRIRKYAEKPARRRSRL